MHLGNVIITHFITDIVLLWSRAVRNATFERGCWRTFKRVVNTAAKGAWGGGGISRGNAAKIFF
jgi:hypothetical protein